jgi:sec-independent protein translocase protein TatA
MIGDVGFPELLIILAIVLLVFGVGRVGRVGKELGSAINEFRKGLKEDDDADSESALGAPESKSGTSVKP